MKLRKILRILLLLLLLILSYEMIGIFAGYKRQPVVSEEVKAATDISTYYNETSKVRERAAVIEDNGEALVQRVRLIENAENEIVLSTFAFHSDESGKIVLASLLNAAERGVKVRVVVDGFDGLTSMEGNPYFYALSSQENIEVKLYNPVNLLKPWKLMGRLHDKYLVVDGTTYIMGGRNTYNYFLGDYPGTINYDRDVLVHCETPVESSSVVWLMDYFETMWSYKDCKSFHEKLKDKEAASAKEAKKELEAFYNDYLESYGDMVYDDNYAADTVETEQIAVLANPIHTGAKEPVIWYQLAEIMKGAKKRVRIHTPYIICNQMMYDSWSEVAKTVPEFSVMTNSPTNNANPFGTADYRRNKEKVLDTGIEVWEYEGGASYHGKSVLIDDDISVIGSFNMDMRSVYLDTEMMLVIRSEEINKQLGANMQEYEQSSRQALKDGKYNNPYSVTPVEAKTTKKVISFLVQHLLGWARFLL